MIIDPISGAWSSLGHEGCLICGPDNPWSWGLHFEPGEPGSVTARFRAPHLLQGYTATLHGGVIAALLDAGMTHCLFQSGIRAVTGDLRIRFLHPVGCETALCIRARLVTSHPPLYLLRGELLEDEVVMAWAEGKFFRIRAKERES